MRVSIALVALLSLFPPLFTFADSASSTNFTIESGVIDAGGSGATSTGFNLRTSAGEPGTGISTSTSFTVRGGFLNFPSLTPSPAPTSPTPAPAPTPPPAGGGAGGGGASFIFPTGLPLGEIPLPPGRCTPELNNDSRVDIADLSILLFYYGQSGNSVSCFDFSRNSTVDFPDISIMMFYWTE